MVQNSLARDNKTYNYQHIASNIALIALHWLPIEQRIHFKSVL